MYIFKQVPTFLIVFMHLFSNKLKYNSYTGSKEELHQDIFTTFIYPYIKEAIEEYYGKPYCYDPWISRF